MSLDEEGNGRRRRVLHVVRSLNRGGIETWLLGVVRHGRSTTILHDVCYQGPEAGALAQQFEAAGSTLHSCQLGANLWSSARRLRRLLTRRRYDVIHIHTGLHSGAAVWAASSAGVPSVVTIHTPSFRPQTSWTRRAWVRAGRQLYGRLSLLYSLRCAAAVSAGVGGVRVCFRRCARIHNPIRGDSERLVSRRTGAAYTR